MSLMFWMEFSLILFLDNFCVHLRLKQKLVKLAFVLTICAYLMFEVDLSVLLKVCHNNFIFFFLKEVLLNYL